MKRRSLGRGLDALLGDAGGGAPGADQSNETYRELPVHDIERGRYQPRRNIKQESLEELAASIRAQGVMQPVVVRALPSGRFELIAGERRWRAAQLAGLATIPAVLRDVPDESAMALALVENIQREDLNPVEEAFALKRLVDEFGLTQQEAADAVGKSRVSVTNLLRLLNLESDVRGRLEEGELEMGHARALLGISGRVQAELAAQVVNKQLSVRETEALVRRALRKPEPTGTAEPRKDADTRSLEEEMSARLGAVVRIDHGAKGAGKVVIRYSTLDELDGILKHLR